MSKTEDKEFSVLEYASREAYTPFYKKAGGVKGKASSSKTRRERHIQEVQATRQQLIDAGIIKPVA